MGFEFKEGTGIKVAAQAAAGLWATGQAIGAQINYKNKMNQINEFERQQIINPYQNLTNPFENLQVATKAAEIKADQTDIALANTLDAVRKSSAGGATALAQAALASKQGIAADIEKQEVQNARLRAQGQLQVDIARGRGKAFAFGVQEKREKQELDRLQAQADFALAQRNFSTQSALGSLGDIGNTLASGIVPPKIENVEDTMKKLMSSVPDDSNQGTIIDPVTGKTKKTPTSKDDLSLLPDDLTIELAPAPADFLPAKTVQSGIDPRVDMNALNSPVELVRMLEKQRLINEGIPVPTGY
tara:strand:+ start:5614 stop:6516 length:903 start_codon:yes stop_codon:yes gene_type:complete